MHAIIIFLYYLSKLLNLTLNLKSLSSRFLNKLILLANFSAVDVVYTVEISSQNPSPTKSDQIHQKIFRPNQPTEIKDSF